MKTYALAAMILLSATASADYVASAVLIGDFNVVESSENTYAGRIHTSYPLTYLFDDNPSTAWVFSGRLENLSAGDRASSRQMWHGDYAIAIRFNNPTRIDKIRIMNGYNKSPEVFAKNDRVAALEVWSEESLSDRLVKRVNLSDKMGWHTISVPPDTYERLILVFTKRYQGKAHDLCISGLETWSKNKRNAMSMTKLVMTTEGSECGCGSNWWVMTRNGTMLARDDSAEGGSGTFSPKGDLVAGVFSESADSHLWVYNLVTGRRLVWCEVPYSNEGCELVWRGENKLAFKGAKTLTIDVPKG